MAPDMTLERARSNLVLLETFANTIRSWLASPIFQREPEWERFIHKNKSVVGEAVIQAGLSNVVDYRYGWADRQGDGVQHILRDDFDELSSAYANRVDQATGIYERFIAEAERFKKAELARRYQANYERQAVTPLPASPEHGHGGLAEWVEARTAALNKPTAPRKSPREELFDARGFHPEMVKACRKLFVDEYQRQAILDGCIAVYARIQALTKIPEDGEPLINAVLKESHPALMFNANVTDSEKSEQRGLALLLRGVWCVLRNPNAHELKTHADGYALECLALLSLLSRHLDGAKS